MILWPEQYNSKLWINGVETVWTEPPGKEYLVSGGSVCNYVFLNPRIRISGLKEYFGNTDLYAKT